MKLNEFVDLILVEKLGFDRENGIMINYGTKILAEIEDDLSDDESEILQKKLVRSLQQLKIESLGILMVLGKLN